MKILGKKYKKKIIGRQYLEYVQVFTKEKPNKVFRYFLKIFYYKTIQR